MKLPTAPNVTRRSFVVSAGAATVVPPAVALVAGSAEAAVAAAHHSVKAPTPAPASVPVQAAKPVPEKTVYLFFNVAEVQFIEPACERLIPADESGAGALAAGVPNYLDKQLGGAWGAGERLYRSGPKDSGNRIAGLSVAVHPGRAVSHSVARHPYSPGRLRIQ